MVSARLEQVIKEDYVDPVRDQLQKVATYLECMHLAEHMISAIQHIKTDRDFARQGYSTTGEPK